MPKYTMAQLMAPSSEWEVSHAHRENFMQELAMIIVAAPHVCNFLWLVILRSSHGILCAFGTSIALEAAILWWFLSHQDTPARIILQTVGLALAGLWIVIRTLVEYGRPAAGAGQALRILGAERWLLAWSMSSWSAILYVMPHIFAFLRQGVDGALATFGCYLLFFALIAQVWVFSGGSLDWASSDALVSAIQLEAVPKINRRNTTRRTLEAIQHFALAIGGAGHYYNPQNWVFAALTMGIGAALLDRKSSGFFLKGGPFFLAFLWLFL